MTDDSVLDSGFRRNDTFMNSIVGLLSFLAVCGSDRNIQSTALDSGDRRNDTALHALEAERRRIEVVARVSPAVVSIFDESADGGGSGVIIDEEGYGLTNFHVIMGQLDTRAGKGGLSDGQVYPLEILGVDITGDVAMFRLTGKDRFDFAPLGDSDTVTPGDPVIAMGNPFALAEDHSPTVTTGIVTGIHRYQGEGDTLVYTDAIQTDAAINPGNSGGPLFDQAGNIIGINGRISAEMHKYARGRYNVGLGYAITINQIKRFIPSLRAGLLAKHGTMMATVMDDGDDVIFNDMYERAPAWNAGVRVGHRLLRFGGVDIRSANQLLSIQGTYPENWPVAMTFDSSGRVVHKVIRLEGVTPTLRREFTVSEEVNRQALQRAVRRLRRAVLGDRAETVPRQWDASIRRRSDQGGEQQYQLIDGRNRPALRNQLDADGESMRRIEFDQDRAEMIEAGGRFSLSTTDVLFYRVMYGLRRVVLSDHPVWADQGARHVGSDALLTVDENGRPMRERPLEAIEIPLSDKQVMRVGLEADSYLPARLVIRDEPTDTDVEIELDDYQEIGGVVWPHRANVRSGQLTFEEIITGLSVEW